MVRGGQPSRMVEVLVLGWSAVRGEIPRYAAGGTNVLTNGDFEANGGSVAGWRAVSAKLSRATDGDGGGSAALVRYAGRAKRITYGLTTLRPGEGREGRRHLCRHGEGAQLHASTSGRVPGDQGADSPRRPCPALALRHGDCDLDSLPTTRLTVRSAGDRLSVTVQRTYQRPRHRHGFTRDSFEADTLTLIHTDPPVDQTRLTLLPGQRGRDRVVGHCSPPLLERLDRH